MNIPGSGNFMVDAQEKFDKVRDDDMLQRSEDCECYPCQCDEDEGD